MIPITNERVISMKKSQPIDTILEAYPTWWETWIKFLPLISNFRKSLQIQNAIHIIPVAK